MSVEVRLTWDDRFVDRFCAPAISDGLNAAAQVLQTEMKRNFVVRSSPGFGTKNPPELGRKGLGPGSYVSAPLANPSYQSGETSRSIQILKRSAGTSLSATVGTKNPVGAMLQNGTSKMAPRPWLSNAVTFGKPKMQDAFLKAARARMAIGNAA